MTRLHPRSAKSRTPKAGSDPAGDRPRCHRRTGRPIHRLPPIVRLSQAHRPRRFRLMGRCQAPDRPVLPAPWPRPYFQPLRGLSSRGGPGPKVRVQTAARRPASARKEKEGPPGPEERRTRPRLFRGRIPKSGHRPDRPQRLPGLPVHRRRPWPGRRAPAWEVQATVMVERRRTSHPEWPEQCPSRQLPCLLRQGQPASGRDFSGDRCSRYADLHTDTRRLSPVGGLPRRHQWLRPSIVGLFAGLSLPEACGMRRAQTDRSGRPRSALSVRVWPVPATWLPRVSRPSPDQNGEPRRA